MFSQHEEDLRVVLGPDPDIQKKLLGCGSLHHWDAGFSSPLTGLGLSAEFCLLLDLR